MLDYEGTFMSIFSMKPVSDGNGLTTTWVHSEGKILDHLIIKHFINDISLEEQNLYLKCYQNLEQREC